MNDGLLWAALLLAAFFAAWVNYKIGAVTERLRWLRKLQQLERIYGETDTIIAFAAWLDNGLVEPEIERSLDHEDE